MDIFEYIKRKFARIRSYRQPWGTELILATKGNNNVRRKMHFVECPEHTFIKPVYLHDIEYWIRAFGALITYYPNVSAFLIKYFTKNPYHLVSPSVLPISLSFGLFFLTTGVVSYWWFEDSLFYNFGLELGVFIVILTIYIWVLHIMLESGNGDHTETVQWGLRLGAILFIISEGMFFFSLFWAYFHVSLSSSNAFSFVWPPKGTQDLSIWGLPLINTILLLSSGVSITLAHKFLSEAGEDEWVGDHLLYNSRFVCLLLFTIFCGYTFLFCQFLEYKYEIFFSWKDNVFGGTFFMTTGFHGLHVFIGTLMLAFCLIREVLTYPNFHLFVPGEFLLTEITYPIFRIKKDVNSFSATPDQHIGFESSAWYWHFVDVVWLFVFIIFYWWA